MGRSSRAPPQLFQVIKERHFGAVAIDSAHGAVGEGSDTLLRVKRRAVFCKNPMRAVATGTSSTVRCVS